MTDHEFLAILDKLWPPEEYPEDAEELEAESFEDEHQGWLNDVDDLQEELDEGEEVYD